jgi:hypothetical protein
MGAVRRTNTANILHFKVLWFVMGTARRELWVTVVFLQQIHMLFFSEKWVSYCIITVEQTLF